MLNILYQFNEKYVPFAGVSIASLLENNKEAAEITIYMLGEQVSGESRDMLLDQIEKYGRSGRFIDASEVVGMMQEIGLNGYRDSYATNIKMFVDHYIPEDVERLLYIDCDTIINGSLSQLFKFDMKDRPVAMALDSMCYRHKQAVGFRRDEKYFNGGVMLFDMRAWRSRECEKRIINHIREERSHYMAPDQDLINIVLKNEILTLKPEYNFQPIHMVYSYGQYMRYFGQSCYYSEKSLKKANRKAVIYHTFRYLGEFPWHKGSMHPATALFDKYMRLSLWEGYIKKETEKNDIIFRIERLLYRLLPKELFLPVFKLSYEIFMWKSNRDSLKNSNNKRM